MLRASSSPHAPFRRAGARRSAGCTWMRQPNSLWKEFILVPFGPMTKLTVPSLGM